MPVPKLLTFDDEVMAVTSYGFLSP